MKNFRKTAFSLLLCAVLVFGGILPGSADAVEETDAAYTYALDDPMSTFLYYVNAPDAENTAGESVSSRGMDAENMVSVNAGEAWGMLNGDENEVVIAVLDSGVNVNHEDLKNVLWVNPGDLGLEGENGFNFSDNLPGLNDTIGHGTHCSGIIGAEANNGKGIAGVASGVKVKIMMLATNSASEDVVEEDNFSYRELGALEYILKAKQNGVNIVAVSNSWGTPGTSRDYEEIFNRLGEEGILCFVAAGNETYNLDYSPYSPAGNGSPYRVTVGAVKEDGVMAGFSNYGRSIVDLFAPGANMLSTVAYPCYFPEIYSAEKRNETTAYYGLFDGTTVIEDGTVTPSAVDCDETVKAFSPSVFHAQKKGTGWEIFDKERMREAGMEVPDSEPEAEPAGETEGEPEGENETGEDTEENADEPVSEPEEEPAADVKATCEFTIIQDHYFKETEHPGALNVTIHNANPGEEYYLYFPYEKDPATTGGDNTYFSIYLTREHAEGDLTAQLILGEVLADKDGTCSFTGGGYSESELNPKNGGLAVHAGNFMFHSNCLTGAADMGEKTAGIGICVIPSFDEDAVSGDIHFTLNSIAVSKPGAEISKDEAYDIMSGTSMACPCAAGAYAVLASIYPRQEGQSGAEYALEMKARLMSCVRQTEELQDKCISGGYLDLDLIGRENPVLLRAECDLENEALVLYGENLGGDYTLSYRSRAMEAEDTQAVELPADGMTAETAPDGKTIVIRNAKKLFSTYTEFLLSDGSGVRAKICDFLVKGQKKPMKVASEPYPQTISENYYILPCRQILTDEDMEGVYGYETGTGVLSVFDGKQFADVRGTDLKESVLNWMREQGYNDFQLRHCVNVEIQDIRNPISANNTLYHPLKVEIFSRADEEYEDRTFIWLLGALDYTAEKPAWQFTETKKFEELFGIFSYEELGFVGAGDKVYCLGNEYFEDPEAKPVPFMFSYDPENNSWTRETGLPALRGELQLHAKNGKIYAACGTDTSETGKGNEVSLNVFCYENGKWKQLADLPYIGNDPDPYEKTLNRVKGASAAVDEGLVFLDCSVEGGGNVFLYHADTGECEPLYYTFSQFKSDDLHLRSAVETKQGIWYFEENSDGYMDMYNLYLIPASDQEE